jgi:hypothetical protein
MVVVRIAVNLSSRWFYGLCHARGTRYSKLRSLITKNMNKRLDQIRKELTCRDDVELVRTEIRWWAEIRMEDRWRSADPMLVNIEADNWTGKCWNPVSPRWLRKKALKQNLADLLDTLLVTL